MWLLVDDTVLRIEDITLAKISPSPDSTYVEMRSGAFTTVKIGIEEFMKALVDAEYRQSHPEASEPVQEYVQE